MFISKAEKFQLDFRITELEKIVVRLLRKDVDREQEAAAKVKRNAYAKAYYAKNKAAKAVKVKA